MFFLPTLRLIAGTRGMKMNDGSEPSPMKSAISMVSLGTEPTARTATRQGIPAETARPPIFAMNIRVEVSTVISLVSRVSDEFKAP